MTDRDLRAAGITDPALRAAYDRCRRLNAAHGRTYYLATRLLPPSKRPHVHALYGFARFADELVDAPGADPGALVPWSDRFLDDLKSGTGPSDSQDLVTRAVIHTAREWGLPVEHFEAFLTSMRMDLTVTGYPTYADLERYMYGSAAVIGLLMVPILEPVSDDAYPPARALGEAFQLTNFIRDVGEDLRRGRVYLPAEDLARFQVTRDDLACSQPNARVVALLAFEIDRTRELYRAAAPGIELLHPTSRDCIATALRLYGGILDAVERSGYDVLSTRVTVPVATRLRVAGPALLRARRARRGASLPSG
ncbi:MAG: phytoene/squalene synthase family protein [Sporichthyaceae bacterium]